MKHIIVSKNKDNDTIDIKIIDENYRETDIVVNDIFEYKLIVERFNYIYRDYKYKILDEHLLLETIQTDVEEY